MVGLWHFQRVTVSCLGAWRACRVSMAVHEETTLRNILVISKSTVWLYVCIDATICRLSAAQRSALELSSAGPATFSSPPSAFP